MGDTISLPPAMEITTSVRTGPYFHPSRLCIYLVTRKTIPTTMIPDCRLTAFVLFVSDIEQSKRFYRDLLGLEIGMDIGINVGFTNGLALWQKDFALNVIHGKETSSIKGNDIEIYFETGSIEDAWETVRSQGVEVVHELREQPWGQRVFRIYDPDRFVVEFGEPMQVVILRMHREGMTEEEIAKKTTMPAEIVHQIMTG